MKSHVKKADKSSNEADNGRPISLDLVYALNTPVGSLADLAQPIYKNEQEAALGKKLGLAIHHWPHAKAEAEQLLALYRSYGVIETIQFIEANPVGPFTVFRLIELAEKKSRREHAKKGAIGKQKKQPYPAIKKQILAFFEAEAMAFDPSNGRPKYQTKAAFIRDAIDKFGIETPNGTLPEPKAVGNWVNTSGLPMPSHWKSRNKV